MSYSATPCGSFFQRSISHKRRKDDHHKNTFANLQTSPFPLADYFDLGLWLWPCANRIYNYYHNLNKFSCSNDNGTTTARRNSNSSFYIDTVCAKGCDQDCESRTIIWRSGRFWPRYTAWH